jgi:glycogen operon protein
MQIPQVEWFDHTGQIMDMDEAWSEYACVLHDDLSERFGYAGDADWYGNRMVDNDFILIFNAHYEPIMFTLPERAVWQANGGWSSTRTIRREPELNYEAGFAITAQSRSFLMLMSDRKADHNQR